MAAWETVSSLTQGTSCRRRDFCHAASRPSNLTWNWSQLAMLKDGYGWICHDASENAGYIQVMALFVGENDDKPSSWGVFSYKCSEKPEEWGGPWSSMEYRRPLWHPLRYQGCHGCRMRTGNCSLEWNLRGFGAGGLEFPGGRVGRAGWFGMSAALFNWDCHYGILWVPMSFFCRWASWLVQHDWGCCTKTTQYLWLFPGRKFGAENQKKNNSSVRIRHKKWGSMGL